MQNANEVIIVAQVIQHSVAPVFLLTGIGSILSVLSGRLGRIIDRFRTLDSTGEAERITHLPEITILILRGSWIHWAITLCTTSALFICIVIVALFAGAELNKDPSNMISMFFVAAMLALTTGLLCFLREISLATDAIKLRG